MALIDILKENVEYEIVNGPSKWDLMLNFFNSSDSYIHSVYFDIIITKPNELLKIGALVCGLLKMDKVSDKYEFCASIVLSKYHQEDGYNDMYQIEGIFSTKLRIGTFQLAKEEQ